MNIEDRQFLTEWGGEKWHTEAEYPDPVCTDYTGKPFMVLAHNRTFDNWTDFGWLWEKLCTTTLYGLCDFWEYIVTQEYVIANPTRSTEMFFWFRLLPEDRCQLICDFLRERGKTA